jgi:hypothetical protein
VQRKVTTYQWVIAIVTVILVAVGGSMILANYYEKEQNNDMNHPISSGWQTAVTVESSERNRSTSARGSGPPATTSQQDQDADTKHVRFDSLETFTHDVRNFSFSYPSDFAVGQFGNADGETIVVQNSDKRAGFQISIRSTDENIQMTKQRIQEDLPNLQVKNPQPVQLGDNAGQGLAFISDNEAFGGNSREVWFTFDGYLYQISTYASQTPLLQKVLSTWQFK